MLKVLVYVKSVESLAVETREEHVHNKEDVHFAFLNFLRDILIVVVEALRVLGGKIGTEHPLNVNDEPQTPRPFLVLRIFGVV